MGKGAAKGAVQGAQDGMLSGMVMGGIAGAMNPASISNPSCCFIAGTTILTSLGKKTIESIKVGDVVPCVDHITGESTEKRVTSTSVRKIDRLIELDIDGEIIRCTETHPFQVRGRGWVNAADLNPGDIVYTNDWGTATIQSVNLLELDEPVEVYNFEVEDSHTYFVGDLDVLVHNGSCHDAQWNKTRKKHWRNRAREIKHNNQVGTRFDSFTATPENMVRMKRGTAPLGWDGYSVELHHPNGIKNDFHNFVEICTFFS